MKPQFSEINFATKVFSRSRRTLLRLRSERCIDHVQPLHSEKPDDVMPNCPRGGMPEMSGIQDLSSDHHSW